MLRFLFLLAALFFFTANDLSAQRVITDHSKQGVVFTGADSCFSADSTRCKMAITFKCEIAWQVYDQYGNKMLEGFGRRVDVSGLPKGGYFMISDRQSFEFFRI